MRGKDKEAKIRRRIRKAREQAEKKLRLKYPLLELAITNQAVRDKIKDRFNDGLKDPLTQNLFGREENRLDLGTIDIGR